MARQAHQIYFPCLSSISLSIRYPNIFLFHLKWIRAILKHGIALSNIFQFFQSSTLTTCSTYVFKDTPLIPRPFHIILFVNLILINFVKLPMMNSNNQLHSAVISHIPSPSLSPSTHGIAQLHLYELLN
jgi:hypothetical protein